ncbi:hypothetical protein [Sphingopyxis panaciterrae]
MRSALAFTALLALAGCSDTAAPDKSDTPAKQARTATPEVPAGTWQFASSGEGSGLFLPGMAPDVADRPVVHFFCPKGVMRLLVNVPSFKPVASEERLSIGAGGTVVTLVADPKGDAMRGGVSGEAPFPEDLPFILRSPEGVRASYGAQAVGPLPAIPAATARRFIDACID